MRTAVALGALLVVGVALLATHGCTALFDPDLVRKDGGFECGAARIPPRPTIADGASGEDVWFGVRRVQLDLDELWATTGLDLDDYCTVQQRSATECRPREFNPDGDDLVDGAGGIDNSYGHNIVDFAFLLDNGFADRVNAEYEAGQGGLLVGLRGWNGENDDPRVQAIFATSSVTTPTAPLPDGGIPSPDGGLPQDLPPPDWDGSDWVWAAADGFEMGDPAQPKVHDRNAYVAGGVVVVNLSAEKYTVAGMPLTDVHLFGRIADGRRSIEGLTLTGRWSVSDLLTETARNCFLERRRLMQNQLDMSADVRSAPGTGGEDVVCDAVSVGLSYESVRVSFGGLTSSLLPRPPFPDFCGLDGGVPSDAGVPFDGGLPFDAGP